jgi:hypothetical protein
MAGCGGGCGQLRNQLVREAKEKNAVAMVVTMINGAAVLTGVRKFNKGMLKDAEKSEGLPPKEKE